MLTRFRLGRRWWAAVAAGVVMAPALLGGVAAAPANEVPVPLPDPAEIEAKLDMDRIADLVPAEFRPLVVEAAAKHQVDPRLVAAVATVESKWDPAAVGQAGELGLMQILPSTGAWLARRAGLQEYDLADPRTNLDFGALYLSILLQEHGTPEKALAVYNGGPKAVESWQSNLYVTRVMKEYKRPVPTAGRQRMEAVAS